MNMRFNKTTLLAGFAVVLAACGGATSSESSSSASSSISSSAPAFTTSNNVILYTRDTTSGTRDGFMGGIGFSAAAKDDNLLTDGFVIADNTAILTAMGGNDKYGIGYVSLSSVNNTVKALEFNGVEASEDTVLDSSYGLKRPFNWMLRSPGDFPSVAVEGIVNAFVAFMGTIEGGEAITGAGAVALESTTRWDDIKGQHDICLADNSGVTVRFGGSDSIEKVAKAVTASFRPRCGNFVAEHEHTGSGDAYKRVVGAQKDEAVGKDVGFASRPFTDAEKLVGGTALPVDQYGQLAWDAIVAIVHRDNPLSNVNGDLLKRMYEKASANAIRTWAQALAAEAAI
jgi:phosphate transport system substrate-binding protein